MLLRSALLIAIVDYRADLSAKFFLHAANDRVIGSALASAGAGAVALSCIWSSLLVAAVATGAFHAQTKWAAGRFAGRGNCESPRLRAHRHFQQRRSRVRFHYELGTFDAPFGILQHRSQVPMAAILQSGQHSLARGLEGLIALEFAYRDGSGCLLRCRHLWPIALARPIPLERRGLRSAWLFSRDWT